MKKFFGEFKKFITRGNVVDMAVGVIVGSSFTAIVNAMSNQILKPVINYVLSLIFKKDSLSELYTFLTRVDTVDETGATVPDLTQSIYIDWGAFINAVINFFLIALVLFIIVKIVNRTRDGHKAFTNDMLEGQPTREERKEMKKQGIKFSNKAAVAAFYAEKAKKIEEEKKAAEEKARLEREANPTTEDLLKQILAEMKKA
ncbi:MAG: large conductance mechanosensitive channel protein MscL [Ruminococcaceae bacterium]|nr:large conductance mechanosensitive channel protein MscL [Oscillospiraceae bacterium]